MIMLRLIGAVLVTQLIATSVVSCDHNAREKIPKTFDYGEYTKKYGKAYGDVETLNRAKLFYARTLGIFKLNSLYLSHKTDHYLKQNEYTDMTASEMKQSLVTKNIDLIPVIESKISPDTPADQFMHGHEDYENDDVKDGYSRSTLSEPKPARPSVNFFSELESESLHPREFVQELVQHSDVAKKLSKVIETKPLSEHHESIVSYRQANDIEFKPMVEPENDHYDPSLVPSYAWSDDVDRATDSFANYMMEDFLGNLEPYPSPSIPTGRVLKDEDLPPRGPSVFAEFMGSIRSFYDYFSKDDASVSVVDPERDELDKEQQADSSSSSSSIKPDDESAAAAANKEPEKSSLVFDIDWRRTGCISRPKSQSKCNSCYAFATLDLMEFFYCRQKKTSTEFSVQYVIDCGGKSDLNGCQGGKLSNVGLFIQRYGLQLNAAYPYNGLEHQCPYDKQDDEEQKSWALKPTISGWRMYPEMQAWYKWIPKSPIIVGINMPSDFLAYGGGIHDGLDCTTGMVHAMLLVGSGKQDGKPFWLLKNTFAETWGEAGYFKLSKKAPIKCFNSAIVARATFNDDQ